MMRHPWRIALVVYVAAAVLYTWPLAAAPTQVLAAPQSAGDPYLNLWILGWDLQTLSQDPAAVITGRVFDAPIFYPARRTLAYSDHLLLPAVVILPVYMVTGSVVLCYNLVLVLSLVASALAMFAFTRSLNQSLVAPLAAGLVWGFWPFHTAHLIHLQLQGLYFLPLSMWCLHRLIASRRRRDAVWLGLTAGLQAVTSVYYGVIGAVGLVVAAVVLGVAVGRWRNTRLLRRYVLAGVVGLIVVAPVIWPYLDVQRGEGFTRNLYQASLNAATPTSYLRAPQTNALYGRTGLLRPARSAEGRGERVGVERELFVGFVVTALALAAIWQAWRRRRAAAWPFVAVAVTGVILSLGPDGVRPLYAWLHEHVFGFQAVRAPARFGVLAAFGLAGLAALRLDAMAVRRPRLAWVLVVAMAAEMANAPMAFVAAPRLQSNVGGWLRQAPGPGAVLYLPLGLDSDNTPAMVESLEHGRPIVNGYSGQRPASFTGLVDTLRDFPSPDALWTLHDLQVRYVVTSSPVTIAGDANPLVRRADFDGRTIYECVWTPAIEANLVRPEGPAPPPPQHIPFGVGEVARYRVVWRSSGALDLAAGEVVFAVTAPASPDAAGGAAFRFDLTAHTSPLVSRFFEARDRFWSLTDAQLLPSLHVQEFREGRRLLDRVAVFDTAGRMVRTANGPPEAARTGTGLPLPTGARDPVSAFYYARSIGLTVGSLVQIPVSDFGRSLSVELRGASEETVMAEGRSQVALRLETRLIYRIEHRQSPRVVIWLSTDERRLPLVADIDAPFGSFRAELISSRSARQPQVDR